MKKTLSKATLLLLAALLLTSCQNNTSPDVTSDIIGSGDESTTLVLTAEAATSGEALVNAFRRIVRENPTITGAQIAEELIKDPLFAAYQQANPMFGMYTDDIPYGRFIAGIKDDKDVPPYVSATLLGPEISPCPYVSYIFELSSETETEDYIRFLKENGDLAWNVCVVADELWAVAERNFVFFVMCPENMTVSR